MFRALRVRLSRSVASRTVWAMSLVLTAMVAALVAGAAAYIFAKADSTLARRADAVLTIVAAGVANPLWDLDVAAASGILSGLEGEPAIIWAELRDERDTVVVERGARPLPGTATLLAAPVVVRKGDAPRRIGTLSLAYSTARAHAAASKEVAALVGAGLLSTLALAACLARLMQRVTAPMAEMTAVMDALRRGRFDAVVPETGRADELGAMARSLVGTVAELRSLNGELAARNTRFDAALSAMAQGLCMLDAQGRLIVCNGRFLDLFGLGPEDAAAGRPWDAIVARVAGPDAPHDVSARLVAIATAAGDGGPDGLGVEPCRTEEATTAAPPADFLQTLPDGRAVAVSHRPTADGGVVATFEDVTERRRAEARVAHMARHDALTDLPNRTLLRERMDEALRRTASSGESLAVLCLDLDRFKAVNDTLGHPVGDALLVRVSERIRRELRPGDTAARLGATSSPSCAPARMARRGRWRSPVASSRR